MRLTEDLAKTMSDGFDIVWVAKVNGPDRWAELDKSIKLVLEGMMGKNQVEIYDYDGVCHSDSYYAVYDQG